MSRVVLSIGSNMGDRLAQLRSVVAHLDTTLCAVSPVYETRPWGGVQQEAFLNAVLIADDPAFDGQKWLHRIHDLEVAADRVRAQPWGPRTLDVDIVTCQHYSGDHDNVHSAEVQINTDTLTLPHPLAHQRAFVLIPWLAVDPQATLCVAGKRYPVIDLLHQLKQEDRDGVARTEWVLR